VLGLVEPGPGPLGVVAGPEGAAELVEAGAAVVERQVGDEATRGALAQAGARPRLERERAVETKERPAVGKRRRGCGSSTGARLERRRLAAAGEQRAQAFPGAGPAPALSRRLLPGGAQSGRPRRAEAVGARSLAAPRGERTGESGNRSRQEYGAALPPSLGSIIPNLERLA